MEENNHASGGSSSDPHQVLMSEVKSEAQGIYEAPHDAQLPSGISFEHAYGAKALNQEIPEYAGVS